MATDETSNKYDAPVPWIGLYVAVASAVCSLLILYDIIHGFIKRQRWLPCKLFKLNSVTLTLIAVVVKLTVDLTTLMHEEAAQISKFSGTVSLCVYMCYIFPSLGELKDSTNMYALSILVITVVVNICIQIFTGVILYITVPAHIVILCFMLFLLLILWHFVLTDKYRYMSETAECKSIFISGSGSFLWRLKVCYLRAYMLNPQFVACMQMDYGTVGDLSLFLWLFLIANCIRHFYQASYSTESAYRWSMELIVKMQFLIVSIGTFASYFRRFTMSGHVRSHEIFMRTPIEEPYLSNPIWSHKFFVVKVANILYIMIMFISYWSVSVPVRVFDWIMSNVWCTSTRKMTNNKTIKAFENLGYKDYDEWTLQKSVIDMENMMKESKRKTGNLCNILSRILTVSPRYPGPRPRDLIVSHEDLRISARLLSLTVLVRVVEASIAESSSCNIILQTFKEAFETLHFIEKYLQGSRNKDREIANAIWILEGWWLSPSPSS